MGIRVFAQISSDIDAALQQCEQWLAELAAGSAESVVAWRWLFGRLESTPAVVDRIHQWMSVAATVNRRSKALKENADYLADPAHGGAYGNGNGNGSGAAAAAPDASWFQSDLAAYLKIEEFCQRVLHALNAARFNGALQYVTTSRVVLGLLKTFCEEFTLRLRFRVKFVMESLQGRSLDGLDYWDRDLVNQDWYHIADREGVAAAEKREMDGALQKLRQAGPATPVGAGIGMMIA